MLGVTIVYSFQTKRSWEGLEGITTKAGEGGKNTKTSGILKSQ